MTEQQISEMCGAFHIWERRQHREWRRWYWAMQVMTAAPVFVLALGGGWLSLVPLAAWWFCRCRYNRVYARLCFGVEWLLEALGRHRERLGNSRFPGSRVGQH